MAADPTDPVTGPATPDIHLWQNMNPVATEALTQLCFGAPQVLYNGGLLQARLRYYDGDRARPGLPPGVAALVERIDPAATALTLINLDPAAARRVIVQAGAFAEHHIEAVRRTGLGGGQSADPTADWEPLAETGPFLEVELGPAAGLHLDLRLALRPAPRATAARGMPPEGEVAANWAHEGARHPTEAIPRRRAC